MAPINAAATGAWTIQSKNNAAFGRSLMQAFFGNNDPSPMNGTRSGVVVTTGLTLMSDLLVQINSGLQLTVAPGSAVIHRSGQGPYVAQLTGSSVLVTCDTAPVSNPRNDIVVMRVYDGALGDTVPGSGPCQIEIITGTPAASPTDPVTPNSLGVITSGMGAGGGVAVPLFRARVSTAGVVTLTDIRRSAYIPGAVRVLLPGDSDTVGRVGDLRWTGTGLDLRDQLGTWQPVPFGTTPPRGVVGTPYFASASGTITTTDTVQVETVTGSVVSGRRYKITHTRSEAGGNILTNSYRVQSGGTLTTSGTLIRPFTDTTPGSFRTTTRVAWWTATFTGTATFGLSSAVNTGTNTVGGGAAVRDLLVEDIGG